MLTTASFARSGTDGGQTGGIELTIQPTVGYREISRAQKDIVEQRLREVKAGKRETTAQAIADEAKVSPALVSTYASALHVEFRRGRRTGTGLKGGSRRAQRSINIAPEVWEEVESQRLDGESLNDAVERILRRALKLIQ